MGRSENSEPMETNSTIPNHVETSPWLDFFFFWFSFSINEDRAGMIPSNSEIQFSFFMTWLPRGTMHQLSSNMDSKVHITVDSQTGGQTWRPLAQTFPGSFGQGKKEKEIKTTKQSKTKPYNKTNKKTQWPAIHKC